MKKGIIFLCFCIFFSLRSSSNADVLLYDVNFSSPPHILNQPPVLGGGLPPRYMPSCIPFAGPQVVQSVGTLTDQPCKFKPANQWYPRYAQMEFDLSPEQSGFGNIGFSTIYPRYIVEMDVVIEQLMGQYNDFTILFDTPSYRNLHFNPGGTVSYDVNYKSGTIGAFVFGQVLSLKVDVDLRQSNWKIWLDGKRIHSGPFYSNTLGDFRINLGDEPQITYGNLAAVDNVKVYALTRQGDIDQDDNVDENDLEIFVEQWLQTDCNNLNGCDGADIDDSNQVDFLDYAVLASEWLKPANAEPFVEAGPNQNINLPNLSVNLDGTVSDDGQPNAVTTQWTKLSGPGDVTFGNANLVDTAASFSQAGSYVLRLTANDGQLTTCDDVKIMINQAPQVQAIHDQTFAYPQDWTYISGNISDDGLPNPPGVLTTHWSLVSGPGNVTFENAYSVWTRVDLTNFGTYVFRLTADDGAFSVYDDITINYFEVLPPNQPPDVNAGSDITVFEHIPVQLNGTVTDDGLPSPPGQVTFEWTQIDGPMGVPVMPPDVLNPMVFLPEYGVYVFRLTANDGELTAYDDVTIKYLQFPENLPPDVNAGSDITVFEHIPVQLNGTVTDDGLPSPPGQVTFEWTQIDGPMGVPVMPPDVLNPMVFLPEYGVYVFRLTANDGELTAYDDVTIKYLQFPENLPPDVNAGSDITVFEHIPVQLNGTVTDDGLPPPPPEQLTFEWTQIDGPMGVPIMTPDILNPTVFLPEYGTYVFRLTASDGELTAYDDVTIYNQEPGINQPPWVHAGPDQDTGANNIQLYGMAFDDGLPNPPHKLTTLWTIQSGPGTAIFSDDNEPTTNVTFTADGIYVLRLTAGDGELTFYDEVTINYMILPSLPSGR